MRDRQFLLTDEQWRRMQLLAEARGQPVVSSGDELLARLTSVYPDPERKRWIAQQVKLWLQRRQQ